MVHGLTLPQNAMQNYYSCVIIPPAYEVCHGGIMFSSFLSLSLSVCVCVCVNNFRVPSVTLKLFDIFSRNFTQTLNTIRRRAEHMNRNFGFCPLCVNNFRVRSITLKPLDIFSRNFTQTLNTIRRRAEHKNCNSGFPTFGVIALCVLTFFVSAP